MVFRQSIHLAQSPAGNSTSFSNDKSREDGNHGQDMDVKREEFRKYLEDSGVLDVITKALIALYQEAEKPQDALEYISKYIGRVTEDPGQVEVLKSELDAAKTQVAELEAKLQAMNVQEEPSA